MTNLERMKENIIYQIQDMKIEEFEKFLDLISGDYAVKKSEIPFDLSKLFLCSDCWEKYGDCNNVEGEDVCSKRFAKYAKEEIDIE